MNVPKGWVKDLRSLWGSSPWYTLGTCSTHAPYSKFVSTISEGVCPFTHVHDEVNRILGNGWTGILVGIERNESPHGSECVVTARVYHEKMPQILGWEPVGDSYQFGRKTQNRRIYSKSHLSKSPTWDAFDIAYHIDQFLTTHSELTWAKCSPDEGGWVEIEWQNTCLDDVSVVSSPSMSTPPKDDNQDMSTQTDKHIITETEAIPLPSFENWTSVYEEVFTTYRGNTITLYTDKQIWTLPKTLDATFMRAFRERVFAITQLDVSVQVTLIEQNVIAVVVNHNDIALNGTWLTDLLTGITGDSSQTVLTEPTTKDDNQDMSTQTDKLTAVKASLKTSAANYAKGAGMAAKLAPCKEVAHRFAAMAGVENPQAVAGIEAMIPLVAASAGAVTGMDTLQRAGEDAALAQGVLHGDAVMSQLRDMLAKVFEPMIRAQLASEKGSEKGSDESDRSDR